MRGDRIRVPGKAILRPMYEPEPEPPAPAPRVLWGRVGVAVAVIVVAFAFGRCGAGGVPEDEVAQLQAQVTSLQSENDQLRARVDSLNAQISEAPTPSASESSAPAAGEGVPGGTWTVAAGDSLYSIAQQVYGDGEKAPLIADANGISSDATLQVGQVLQLPLDG
jgi:LysM repeat protein